MNKEITSKIIGLLKQDIFPDWWRSNEIEIPFFDNKKLQVIFTDFEPQHDTTFIEEADQALTHFLNLKTEDRNAISELVYKNCTDFFEATGFNEETVKMFQKIEDPQDWHLQTIKRGGLLNLQDINDVWQFVYPTEIYVTRRPDKDKDIYIQITCECDWEDEHGLQLVYKQGKKLTRISEQDGHLFD